MEAVGHLLHRIWLFFFLFWLGQGRRMAPPGFVESSCRSRIFWMKLNKLLLQGKFFQLEIYDPHSGPVLLDEQLASRCGYVLSEDVWGNPVFRASVLGCHVANEADELFSLTVNIKVSSFLSMRAAVTYTHPMYCSYASWASREIVCEENYMEVSVKTDVPAVSNDYTVAWMSALPETQNVAYQQWQLMFVSPSGRKRITVSDAVKLGYSFNNSLSRVYLRAPYHSNESDVSVVSGVTMNMITSTSMYRQRWLLLLIDTTVSCPVDGISFTNTTLTWTVPRVIPTLVVQESTFLSKSIVMGVDDQVIVNPEEMNYLLEYNETHIRITIPTGAEGGKLEEVSFQKIKARFDVALRKVRTMETLQMFSISCSFNSSAFIICHPDGTIMVSAQMKTVPAIDMSKTKLRDSSCKPKEYNEAHAFFKFHVTTCGTSVRFEGDHIIYENEISYEKETLPRQSIPTITRDPDYRLTVLCYYQAKETLVLGAFSRDPATSPPFGSGTMFPRSNTAAYRRVRQALNVVSRVSKDESFMEFYGPSTAILKQPMEPVFLEVELKDKSPSVELYLENCWVASSPDFNSNPRWNITVNGCEINGSEFAAEFCPVPVSPRVRHPPHFKRLAVRTLAQQLEQVYVHCLVAACSPTNAQPGSTCRGQCISSRERKGFPGHPSDSLQGYVLAGPVWIVAPDRR